MPAPVTFDEFWRHLGEAKINLSTDTFKLALTNTAPSKANNTVLADITQISTANGYTQASDAAGKTVTLTWAETGAGTGIWQLGGSSSDAVWTAAGGSIGPFRYVVLVDDTPTSPANPLVAYIDYGSAITVPDTGTFTVDAGATGWLQLTSP